MQDEELLLKKRLTELAMRAEKRRCRTNSEFLTLAEQDTLSRLPLPCPVELSGGFPAAERKIALFGEGEGEALPLACLCIEPRSQKFADALGHRDLLGALMNLGLRREVLGDILISDNRGYLICLSSVADYIAAELTQVKRTSVRVALSEDIPQEAAAPPPLTSVNVASERLDAIVAAVFRLSRGESQRLFSRGLVSVNGRETENTSLLPPVGAVISVRGSGRFIYEGIKNETRSGRLYVQLRKY